MLLKHIKAATYRHCGGFSWFSFLKLFLALRCFRPVVTLHLCQATDKFRGPLRIFYILSRLLHRLVIGGCAMDFNWRASVGYGLCINHGWGMVVGYGVKIGNNVTLYHGVTLGRVMKMTPDGARSEPFFPTIEDDVWIGPNVVIVGDVTIGKGSRIAANSYINKSIPPHSLVVSAKSEIVKENCKSDVVNKVDVSSL